MKCPMYDSCTLRSGACVASLPDNGCYWYRWFKDLIQKTENPWNTGTPTEDGEYLCVFKRDGRDDDIVYGWCTWDGKAWDIYLNAVDYVIYSIVAWMPIPPYIENPIEAFMRKQPCDKCLFQNTPNCKIFGIGVNGEMGCSFKERVRMSELKDDSAVVLERTT